MGTVTDLVKNRRLPIIAVSIVVIVALVVLFVAMPSFTRTAKSNNDLTVYPQIRYQTQLKVGEAGTFYPNIYELDSKGTAHRNPPYLFKWNFGDGTKSVS
jgi:hypothetical protein